MSQVSSRLKMSAAASTGLTLCSCDWLVYVSQGALISFMRGNLQPTALAKHYPLLAFAQASAGTSNPLWCRLGLLITSKSPAARRPRSYLRIW